MTRKRWVAIAAVAVVLVAAFLFWKRPGAQAAPKYRTASVDRGGIESVVSATGTIQPVEQVEVGSQVSGTVNQVSADYNSRVHKGQVLCVIEPSSFRARVVESDAAVAKARAAVKDARRVALRAQTLLKENYVSQAEVDGADVALEQRLAELKQAQAALQMAQVDLNHTVIRAPIDGVVISRSIDVGQTVAASLQSPKLFVIANDLSRMQVETKIDESDIGRIHQGLPVSFSVDAFPDQMFRGTVSQVRLEPITEQNVVTYTTVMRTDNPDLLLRPGMTANVSVQVARREDVLRVPAAALRFRPPAAQGRGGRPGAGQAAGGGGVDRGGVARADGAPPGAGASGAGRGRGRGPGGAGFAGGGGGDSARAGRGGGRGGMMAGGGGSQPGRAVRGLLQSGGEVVPASIDEADASRPGSVYVLRNGKPEKVAVVTGLTDGSFVEIRSGELKEGDVVVIGLDQSANRNANQLAPPPGLGGPGMGGPRGGGRR